MAERLTTKQREFLAMCDSTVKVGYTADLKPDLRAIPYHFGPLAWSNWRFYTESEAMRFVDRLLARGLIRTDKRWFYWITDAGRQAIAQR